MWIVCGECDFGAETLEEMVAHILESHTGYTPEMAQQYAELWLEDAYEQEELRNMRLTEEYRRGGNGGVRDDN